MDGNIACPHCAGSGSIDEANPDFYPDDDDCAEDETIAVACPSCSGFARVGLIACPFCASRDAFIERADTSTAYVMCNDCGARGPVGDPLESDDEETPGGINAAAGWNRRMPLPPPAPNIAPGDDPEAQHPTPSES